jgi:hypothetical protein
VILTSFVIPFLASWDFSEVPEIVSLDSESQMERLVPAIQLVSGRRGDHVKILIRQGPYLRVLFEDGKSGEESVGEFYFTPNDTTVQFRVAGVGGSAMGFGASSIRNIERCELIRKEMRYLKVPVLRNRKRTLFFFESDMDTFGPGSANLGSPVERNTREFDEQTFPNFKIDLMQQFPTPPK